MYSLKNIEGWNWSLLIIGILLAIICFILAEIYRKKNNNSDIIYATVTNINCKYRTSCTKRRRCDHWYDCEFVIKYTYNGKEYNGSIFEQHNFKQNIESNMTKKIFVSRDNPENYIKYEAAIMAPIMSYIFGAIGILIFIFTVTNIGFNIFKNKNLFDSNFI